MLALYLPRNSIVHRASPSLKVVALAPLALGISLTSNLIILCAALALIASLYAIAKLPAKAMTSAVRPVVVLLIMVAILQGITTGWSSAIVLAQRMVTLILAAALVTYTTRTSDMIEGVAAAVRSFARFGVSPAKTGLALALAIRFIPAMLHHYREIEAARMARGGRRFSIMAIGPLLLGAIRMSEDVSDAVIARGFEERDRDDG